MYIMLHLYYLCLKCVQKYKGTDIFVKALIEITQKYDNVVGLIVDNCGGNCGDDLKKTLLTSLTTCFGLIFSPLLFLAYYCYQLSIYYNRIINNCLNHRAS